MAPANDSTAKGIDVSKVDACALLTRAEVEAVMGPVEYKPHAPQSVRDEKDCNYVQEHNQDDGTIKGQELDVVIWPSHYWEMHQALSAADATPVAGIGDEAFTVIFPTLQTLFVRVRAKAIVEVHVYPKNVENAKKLALKVLEHLP